MLVSQTLQAFMRSLSERSGDDRTYDALIQALKGNMAFIRARKKCDLLVMLKKRGIATNDVEYTINRMGEER